jgi:hypothetical protein
MDMSYIKMFLMDLCPNFKTHIDMFISAPDPLWNL